MNNELQVDLEELVTSANQYIKTGSQEELNTIFDELKRCFDVEYVELWKSLGGTKEYELLDSSKKVICTFGAGLTLDTLVKKKPLYSNHIISEKKYQQKSDNQENYKIKALFIIPIVSKNSQIGVLRLYRSTKSKKFFTTNDMQKSFMISKIFINIIEKKHIKSSVVSKESIQKNSLKETQSSSSPKIREQNLEATTNYKNEILSLEDKNKKLQDKVKQLEDYINEKETVCTLEIEEYEIDIQKASKEQEKLKSHVQKLNNEIDMSKATNIKCESYLAKMKTSDEKNILKILTLKKEHQVLEKSLDGEKLQRTSDKIMNNLYSHYNENENITLLFELINYIPEKNMLSSKIESAVKKSKITKILLDLWVFKKGEKIKERTIIDIFIKKIQLACELSLEEQNTILEISVEKNTPASLYFHSMVLQNILIRYIIRMQIFMNSNELIRLSINFFNKELVATLKFKIQKENKNKNFFKSSKDIMNDSSQLSSILNTKLLSMINGEVNTQDNDKNYSLEIRVPALIISI